ncbi:MAG: sulfotransferase [Alcanivoracaceae bacterium]|nr:sulfotransferase [Alcanivoracaceae bacterium]
MTEAITKIERLIERGSLVQAQAKLKSLGNHEDALRLQAKVLLAQGQAGPAQQLLLAALKQHPRNREIYRDLGSLYARAGHLQQAVKVFEQAVHVFPDEPIGYRGIGECLVVSKEFRRAAEFLVHAWDKDKSDYKLAAEISKLLLHIGDYVHAEPLVDAAYNAEPDNPAFAFLKAEVCFFRDQPEQAFGLYEKAKGSDRIVASARQVACLTMLDRIGEALALVDTVLEREAQAPRADLLAAKAQLLMIKGDKQGATILAREALALDRQVAPAWSLLSQLDAGALSDADVKDMTEVLGSTENVDSRVTLGFALAGAYEARGDLVQQLACLDRASALKQAMLTYDVGNQRRYMDKLCEAASRHAPGGIGDLAALAPESGTTEPLFVVGMPRSGTTLMEQVLSAHPQVEAGGESHAFRQATDQALDAFGLSWQEQLWQRPPIDYMSLLAEGYRAFHAARGVEAPFVTDKAITLYRYLGILKAALPSSRIIIMHRHPLDLALGQYKQLFATGQQFTYRADWIADALAGFYRMLAFWEQWGVEMLHVSYESLVHEQEAVTRRVLAFAGLPWDDACLHFHKNQRAVITASAVQVREGLFTRAAGRWQRYGELLDPFREAMVEAGVDITRYETEGPEALVRAAIDTGVGVSSSVTDL